MSLFLIILAIAVTFGILFALISYVLIWFQRRTSRQFEQLFQDANQIIQEERPPAAWVQRERNQLKRWRSPDKHTAAETGVGNRAKRRCLHRLRVLIRFLENGRFYDSLATRDLMVERLWAIHEQWLKEPVEYFLEQ